VNLYSLFVYIEHNGNESPKDTESHLSNLSWLSRDST